METAAKLSCQALNYVKQQAGNGYLISFGNILWGIFHTFEV